MNIFIDLDETLIFTRTSGGWEKDYMELKLNGDPRTYYVKVRPSAPFLIEMLKNFGNVYLLTSASKEYTHAVLNYTRWKFTDVFTVEDLHARDINGKDNVLIDDCYPKYNVDKMNWLGIDESNYYQIPKYKGEEDSPIIESCIEFIRSHE